jgi:hypothetical protein
MKKISIQGEKTQVVILPDGTRAWATETGFVRGHDIGFPIRNKKSWFWHRLRDVTKRSVHPDWLVGE